MAQITTKVIRPDQVIAIRDSREKLPFNLAPLRAEEGTLTTGDYSVKGMTDRIAIERKSLEDLIGCVGQNRDRFDREIQRLKSYETAAVVVEASWEQLESGAWIAKVTKTAAMGSVCGWLARGVNIIFAGDRARAERITVRLLFTAARRLWSSAYDIARAVPAEVVND